MSLNVWVFFYTEIDPADYPDLRAELDRREAILRKNFPHDEVFVIRHDSEGKYDDSTPEKCNVLEFEDELMEGDIEERITSLGEMSAREGEIMEELTEVAANLTANCGFDVSVDFAWDEEEEE